MDSAPKRKPTLKKPRKVVDAMGDLQLASARPVSGFANLAASRRQLLQAVRDVLVEIQATPEQLADWDALTSLD